MEKRTVVERIEKGIAELDKKILQSITPNQKEKVAENATISKPEEEVVESMMERKRVYSRRKMR